MQTEILVHISAPSKVKDDARYRNIVQEIIDFQPTSRFDVTNHSGRRESKCISEANLPNNFRSQHTENSAPSLMHHQDVESNLRAPRAVLKRKYSTASCSTPYSPSQPNFESIHLHTERSQDRKLFDRLSHLDQTAAACVTGRCKSSYDTYLTDRLRDIERQHPIDAALFPTQLLRKVSSHERGYWCLMILIGEATEVDRWRAARAARNSILVGPDLARNPWTFSEFEKFWLRLLEEVRSNQLGPVSAHRTSIDYEMRSKVPTGFVKACVRVYCWGETLAYIYLALRWMSVGLIDYVPMQWVGSDGHTVILISGEEYYRQRKRTPGQR